MTCKYCGFEAPDNARFCSQCGARLPQPKNVEPEQQPVITQVKPVLEPVQAAKLIGISRWMLDELRKQGKLPENCYFILPQVRGTGKRLQVRYRAKELIEWRQQLKGPLTTAG